MRAIRNLIIILGISFVCLSSLKAQNLFYILRVHVSDSASSLPLRNAVVTVPSVKKSIKTDSNGEVRFGMPEGLYLVLAEYEGYHMEQMVVSLNRDTSVTIRLRPSIRNYIIEEVTITASRFDRTDIITPGIEKLSHASIQNMASMAGEKDLVKTISNLPGVTQGSEGSADIYVRGGSTDQNLYLLDNNIIYKPSHLLGFLTSINPLGIEEAEFYKAGFPARYGGKLSSVIDVKTRNPGMDSLLIKSEISTISAKILADIPLIKDKSGVIINGRATYMDKLYSLFARRYNYNNTGFYDMHIKVQHKLNDKNTINLGIYSDRDYYSDIHKPEALKDEYSIERQKWKNNFARISLDHHTEKRGLIKLYTGISNYKMDLSDKNVFIDSTRDYKSVYRSSVKNITGGINYSSRKDSINSLTAGIEAKYHLIVPSELEYSYSFSDTIYTTSNVEPSYMTELNSYIAKNFIISDKLRLSTGLRFSYYYIDEENYISLEPRLGIQYLTGKSASLKGSWARTTQPLHMLTNPGLGMPMDIYIPFSGYYCPATADQYAIAFNTRLEIYGQSLFLTLEAYYKSMNNILAYRAGYSSHNLTSRRTQPVFLQDIVTSGTGESFGSELIIEKPTGKLNGWLAYSLSKTTHNFEELNGGIPFPAKHHRPHNLSLVLNYSIDRKNRISVNFKYITGERVTLPEYIFNMASFDFSDGDVSTYWLMHPAYSNSEINAYKMKDFHRLNISYTHSFERKKWAGALELSIYNVYNRRNSYYYYLDATIVSSTNNAVIPTLKSVSLFPIIPAISLKIDLK